MIKPQFKWAFPCWPRSLATVSFFALVAAGIVTGFFSWANSDDFYLFKVMQQNAVLPFTAEIYRTWSGRAVTWCLLAAVTGTLDLTHSHWAVAVVTSLLGISAYLMAGLLAANDYVRRLLIAAWFLTAFWLGLTSVIQAVTIWLTGGLVYTVPLTAGLVWLLALRARLVAGRDSTAKATIGFFFLSVILGNGIELLSPALFISGAGIWARARKGMTSSARRLVTGALTGLALGSLILAVAPGNLGRFRSEMGGQEFQFTLTGFISGIFGVLKKFIFVSYPFLGLCVAGALVINLFGRRIPRSPDLPTNHALEGALYVLAALGTVVPIAMVPSIYADRTAFFFAVFLGLGLWCLVREGVEILPKAISLPRWGISYVCVAVAGFGIAQLGADLPLAIAMRTEVQARHRRLTARAGYSGTVIERPLAGRRPKFQYTTDLGGFDNVAISRNLQTYYSIGKIVVAKAARSDRTSERLP